MTQLAFRAPARPFACRSVASVAFALLGFAFVGAGAANAQTAARGQTKIGTPTTKATAAAAAAAAAIIPAEAVAPWPVLRYVNALSFSSRIGLTTVWGAYGERSKSTFEFNSNEQTQELGNAAGGRSATYANIDLGNGVESFILRVSLPSGVNGVEVRLGTPTGTLVGSCVIDSTGGPETYKTVGCPVDPQLARGRQTLVFRFTGPNAEMRFNWFAFWAADATQAIDKLQKVQVNWLPTKAAPILPMAGRPTRSQSQLPGQGEVLAQTYGVWAPSQAGDCPKWLHDTYWVRGDDGKVYPTWHPPVEFNPETGKYCTFGHEHGDDPRGSEAFAVGGLPPFGLVNEAHSPNNPALRRTEDHFGHKVRVVNNFKMYDPGDGSPRVCDLVVKTHMGTHSPDALTNTAHELITYGQCEGQQPFNLKYFTLFGAPGSFKEAEAAGCNQFLVSGIAPTPPTQPDGGQHRAIPTRDCFQRGTTTEKIDNLRARSLEFWLTSYIGPGSSLYIVVEDPSRFYDPLTSTKIGRTVDLCYDATHPMASSDRCQLTVAGSSSRIAFNDPRSWFRGAWNGNTHVSALTFAASPTSVVYTNVYAQGARPTPDVANGITVKQLVPSAAFSFRADGNNSLFPMADYSAIGQNGVRAPN